MLAPNLCLDSRRGSSRSSSAGASCSSAPKKERIERAQQALQLDVTADHSELVASLERLPNLTKQLRRASPELKRALFDAFERRIVYDKPNNRVQISAPISEEVADALGSATELPQESRTEGHGGGRFHSGATVPVCGPVTMPAPELLPNRSGSGRSVARCACGGLPIPGSDRYRRPGRSSAVGSSDAARNASSQ